MNIVLDANMPFSAAEPLSAWGTVTHVRNIGLGDASDQQIAAYACEHKAILITRDIGFSNPHLFPSGSHRGLVILRLPHNAIAQDITRAMQTISTNIAPEDMWSWITIITPTKIRRRPLHE